MFLSHRAFTYRCQDQNRIHDICLLKTSSRTTKRKVHTPRRCKASSLLQLTHYTNVGVKVNLTFEANTKYNIHVQQVAHMFGRKHLSMVILDMKVQTLNYCYFNQVSFSTISKVWYFGLPLLFGLPSSPPRWPTF
jgi:hypothetical protein